MSLSKALIKLAYEDKSVRPYIIPLLKEAGVFPAKDIGKNSIPHGGKGSDADKEWALGHFSQKNNHQLQDEQITGTLEKNTAKGVATLDKKAGYRNDPYWLILKWDGVDMDGNKVRRGAKVWYYPATKKFLYGPKAEAAAREFNSRVQDEDVYNGGRYASVNKSAMIHMRKFKPCLCCTGYSSNR
jgi:hypothetical protein